MKPLQGSDPASLSMRVKKIRKKTAKFYKQTVDTHLKNRSLRQIERFVFSWLAVFALIMVILFGHLGSLADHYLEPGPAPGGSYSEGMVGSIGGFNPLFADSQVSEAANKLIFSGLMRTDASQGPELDLAADYEINDEQTEYTFRLRDDISWHDGQPVTAEDVAFTIDLIQNPDVGSHLRVDWSDIDTEVVDERNVRFELPNPYAPFLSQLSVGILPRHLLKDTDPQRLRVTAFNQDPVGSGPFMFDEISSGEQVRLRANPDYHKGSPALERFNISVYETEEQMIEAYNRGELGGMAMGSTFDNESLDSPDRSYVYQLNVASQVFAFLNNDRLEQRRLRQALVQSINADSLRRQLGSNYRFADSPLMPGQLGYRPAQLPFDTDAALDKFDKAGWKLEDGRLMRDGNQLSLDLVTQDNYSYPRAAETLKQQWGQVGVEVNISTVSGNELQEDHLRPRDFDVLLFGIGLDRDPDVYGYWHSSQVRDPGRNVAQYRSELADTSLEDGRTRINDRLRAAKYETFQQQWRQDAPAAALYRLHAYYVHRRELRGTDLNDIIQPVERYHNVTDWTINSQPVLKRLSS